MNATGVGPIQASTSCHFKIPLTYPDTVSIGPHVSEIQDDRFTMKTTLLVINISELLLKALAYSLFQLNRHKETPVPQK